MYFSTYKNVYMLFKRKSKTIMHDPCNPLIIITFMQMYIFIGLLTFFYVLNKWKLCWVLCFSEFYDKQPNLFN